MKTVVLDTNILMAIGQFGLDLFGELSRICLFQYETAVLSGTVKELRNITDRHAALALQLIEQKCLIIEHKPRHVDDVLVKMAQYEGVIVATADMGLKKRLENANVRHIELRQKKKLIFIE